MKKVIFCGFGKLGKDCLEKLVDNGYAISFILTHKELSSESVDTFAERKGLAYSYIDARKDVNQVKATIANACPDYLISINYRYIIPKEILKVPLFAINIHGSLLPKYRGRTPHVWSIINGEKYSGVTSHIMEETIDTGDIIEQVSVKINSDDTGYSLLKKYEALYPELLMSSLKKIAHHVPFIKQNEREASFFGKRTPEMGYIDFYKCANEVINFVRAQANPYPGAYYFLKDGRKIIINQLVIEKAMLNAMTIGVIELINDIYYVKCKDSVLKIVDYKVM
ncbi:methionyl-tRNA formyltransferase [Virgibacillus halodenitrificans]|uniref:methionyl-tRNA formyltransferase n=1 Tax=Virgibacillus halodenitrificans TaxID=1482 RepID=UPI001FB4E744|nr:methionyl-tRNA formyltransferase [Virgibacillus halodenitrificans]MCJ0929757.1 methionyl-tRNA formyltransferase [Virgibacillus halodenitrificans]